MKLKSSGGHNNVLEVSDSVDSDGDVYLVTESTLNYSSLSLFYLNKSGAAILVKHLQEVFELEN